MLADILANGIIFDFLKPQIYHTLTASIVRGCAEHTDVTKSSREVTENRYMQLFETGGIEDAYQKVQFVIVMRKIWCFTNGNNRRGKDEFVNIN